MIKKHLKSAQATKRFGAGLARKLVRKKSSKKALILALSGDLGSGKTTFVQGFLRELGIRDRITSPTFVLVKKFGIQNPKSEINAYGRSTEGTTNSNIQKSKLKTAYHIDCYRIKKVSELTKLGLKEILKSPQNVVLIEWAEKIRKILPKNTIWIEFTHGKKENIRNVRINPL